MAIDYNSVMTFDIDDTVEHLEHPDYGIGTVVRIARYSRRMSQMLVFWPSRGMKTWHWASELTHKKVNS